MVVHLGGCVSPILLGKRGLGGDRVLCKEYGCNLQDIRLIGRLIAMTSLFRVAFVRYRPVAQW